MFRSVIHHTFGPHATLPFALRSLWLLLRPWKWRNGPDQQSLRHALQHSFGGDVFLFSTAREAMAALFRAIHLRSGEEVIIQAFTCVVVPNAVHACGGVPIYSDVDGDTLNLDCSDVERKITPRTRAVIAQHTFGIPADLLRLRKICNEHHILLIEDCAHMLPDDPASPIGRTGDVAIMSFARDKGISGIAGGAVISRNAVASETLRDMETHAGQLPRSVIARLLLYPLLYRKARALFLVGLGWPYLALCKALHLFIPTVTAEEKRGEGILRLRSCPNACAALALYSFQQLAATNAHRRVLTRFYIEECGKHGWNVIPGITAEQTLQKFPLFFPNADALRKSLKRENIILDDGWTGCVICPRGTDNLALEYAAGSDPKAESVCEEIVNLPTHPVMTMQQAKRLIHSLAKTS